MLSAHTALVDAHLHNAKITITSKKAPTFLTDYRSALYNRVLREHRQVQSLEVLKKRNSSIELIEPPRECSHAIDPDWTTDEPVTKVIERLEKLLPLLNV